MSGRGVQNNGGGAFDGDAINQIVQTDPFQGQITVLTGTADVINPYNALGANYIANGAAPDLTTLAAPVAVQDDGLAIAFYSASAQAHRITSTGNLQTGTASVNSITLAAFAGAGVVLRAYNGKWQIVGFTGTLTLA